MMLRLLALLLALLFPVAAYADCANELCASIQKIFDARSGNFAKLKGAPGHAPRGDPFWQGTLTISGLLNYCRVYARGEGARYFSRYEYRCDSSESGTAATLPLAEAKVLADRIKSAIQSADSKLVWFDDPDAGALAKIEGFEGSQAWYGGTAPSKFEVKVAVFGSAAGGSSVAVTVFAKPLVRRDVK